MATVEASASAPRAPLMVGFAGTDNTVDGVGRIGPWQLVRLIHESPLSRVYAARSESSPSQQPPAYAVKVLRKEWWADPVAIQLQRRAAWIGARVSHPHLLPVLSSGVQQPPFYTVSPLLGGVPLSRYVGERELPLPTMLWAVRQVAEGLEALHRTAGAVHSDVKPGNIVLAADGHATLIDLGFAQTPAECLHWTQRPVVGSLGYVAPEAVTSRMTAGPAADLYSLGVTLYELITGRLPLEAESPEELVRQHREVTPDCVRHLVPTLPKGVASLVHRLLAKDPLRRPASAAAVAEELTGLEIECFGVR
ncbi:MAG: serine/threonine-protein kinase [Planctomycetota bacterium]